MNSQSVEGRSDASDYAEYGDPHPLPYNELAYRVAVRTERHADAHLLSALRDGVGHQTVYADGGEQQRHRAENGKQQHIEALSRGGPTHHLIHGADVAHRESSARDAQLLGDGGNGQYGSPRVRTSQKRGWILA
jgi:hypothetical protein